MSYLGLEAIGWLLMSGGNLGKAPSSGSFFSATLSWDSNNCCLFHIFSWDQMILFFTSKVTVQLKDIQIFLLENISLFERMAQ